MLNLYGLVVVFVVVFFAGVESEWLPAYPLCYAKKIFLSRESIFLVTSVTFVTSS